MAEFVSRRNRAPTHPGALLKEDILPNLKLTVAQAADYIGVTRQQLYKVISGESGISPDMALRLGKLCGNGEGLWARMQMNYDLWQARQRLGDELDRIPTLHVYEAV